MAGDPMTAGERRLLEPLAASDGCTDALLLAHGFPLDMMVDVVRERLATATPEPRMRGDGAGLKPAVEREWPVGRH